MASNGRGHKHDYGIKGYDPDKKGVTRKPYPCKLCAWVGYSKTAYTKHVNNEHWDLNEDT